MLAARVVILGALAFLAAAVPQDGGIAEQRATSLRRDPAGLKVLPGVVAPRWTLRDGVCDICTNAIQSAEEYISDPETQANMAKFLEEQVCDQLPESIAPTCKMEVPIVVNMVIVMMRQSVPPDSICAYMGLCDPTAAAKANGANGQGALDSPFDCPMCKVVVEVALARFSDPAMRQQIVDDLNAACETMDTPEGRARCHAHVAALFKAIDDLMHDVDPEGVCELGYFCPRKNLALRAAPPALGQLRAAAARLASLPRANPASNSLLRDSCESCKTIVTEAAAIIQDPTTQREIIDYAKQGCSVFADFKQQCETYVDLYGPLVINMALQYLQPEPLCVRMGYCLPTPPPAA